jgi:glutaredoxin 2
MDLRCVSNLELIFVKYEDDDLLQDFDNNFNRHKNCLSKIFSNIRQIEPLLLGTSHFYGSIHIETLKIANYCVLIKFRQNWFKVEVKY